ncbi:hypothetical protein PO124_30810 [Bacillus licheniformis]|nr:hypothetical protein [Bacillus licheniformis]
MSDCRGQHCVGKGVKVAADINLAASSEELKQIHVIGGSKMENLLINGFGSSGGGAYQTVELNGKGTINGDIDCERFSCSGTGTVNGDVKRMS